MRRAAAVAAAAVSLGLAAAVAAREGPPAPAVPGSIVLVVGDGTGWQQWGLLVAARRAAGEKGKSAFHRLADQGVVGAATTFAADSLVTDSAAGAVALASGAKTDNGVVGLDPAGNPLPTWFDGAAARGMAAGLVTTTAVTDATTAAFVARVKSRRMMTQVAEQMIRTRDLRVILGGGSAFFVPRTATCAAAGEPGRGVPDAPSQRRDDFDLVAEARVKGMAVATNRKALLEGPAPVRLLGLFAPGALPYALDRDGPGEAEVPSLPEMTRRALEVLGRSEKGFVLVVEGGRVDHACHHQDAGAALAEMRELDAALEVLLQERERRKDLLVIVTADHETGGLGVSAPRGETLTGEMIGRLGTQTRSLEAVAAEVGGGIATAEAARAACPWLPEKAIPVADPERDGRGPYLGKYRKPWGDAASGAAGVVFATDGHTATPVPVVAAGPGAERFAGLKDNTEIGRAIGDLLGGR